MRPAADADHEGEDLMRTCLPCEGRGSRLQWVVRRSPLLSWLFFAFTPLWVGPLSGGKEWVECDACKGEGLVKVAD